MWSEEAKVPFEKFNQDLSQVGALTYPNSENRLNIMVSASNDAVRAVVQQWHGGHWQLFAFSQKR